MIPKIKRMFMMPFINISRLRKLYEKTMTPEEIRDQEQMYHTMYLEANRKGLKEQEREMLHKRDVLRKVLRIDASS